MVRCLLLFAFVSGKTCNCHNAKLYLFRVKIIFFFFCFHFCNTHFKMAGFFLEKKYYFRPIYHIFCHQGEDRGRKSFSTFFNYIKKEDTLAHLFRLFCLSYQFFKNCELSMYSFSLVCLLVWILLHAILDQSINKKIVSKI